MSADLAYRLKDHLYKMLFNNLRNEIAYQVEDVWGGHFDTILAAHETAGKAVQTALEKAQKVQKEFERRHERLIAVFNTVTGLALGWMAAHLQYRVANNYFRRTDWVDKWDAEKRYIVDIVEGEDKVAAKMFGDGVADVIGSMIKLGMSSPKVSTTFKAPDAKAIAGAENLEKMREMIKKAMIAQKNTALGVVEELANRAQSDTAMGERILSRLPIQVSGFELLPQAEQERRGQEALNNWLNLERQTWSRNWAYYSHQPPAVKEYDMQKNVERELWILWILENRQGIRGSLTDINAERVKWFDTIIDHLRNFDLPTLEIVKKRGRNRETEINRLINYCWRHKPKEPDWTRIGAVRKLDPIETFTRPH